MDKSAINEIQQANTTQQANKYLSGFCDTPPSIAIPQDFKIHTLTSESEGINHYKGEMNTDSLSDFSSYVKQFDQDGAACFINTDNMSAKTFLNLGTKEKPQKGDFTASLSLKKTAEYQATLDINGCNLSQSSLAEFIEDWNHCITCHKNDDASTSIDNKTAAKAIRSITISAEARKTFEDQDFKAERSALESISCDTSTGLPAIIKLSCIPYTELSERTFSLRVSLHQGSNEPSFKLRIVALESAKAEMAEELMEKLKDKFSELKTETFIGNFKP